MAKSFAEFMREMAFFQPLRETVERLVSEQKRRRAIQSGLEAVGRQIQSMVSGKEDVYTQQLVALYNLLPIIYQGLESPSQVSQATANIYQQLATIQTQRQIQASTVDIINKMQEGLQNMGQFISSLKDKAPDSLKGVYENLGQYFGAIANLYTQIAQQLAQTGNVGQAVQVVTQLPQMGAEIMKIPIETGLREYERQREFEYQRRYIEELLPKELGIRFEFDIRKYQTMSETEHRNRLMLLEREYQLRQGLEEHLKRMEYEHRMKLLKEEQEFQRQLQKDRLAFERWQANLMASTQIKVAQIRGDYAIKVAQLKHEFASETAASTIAKQIVSRMSKLKTLSGEIASLVQNPDDLLTRVLSGEIESDDYVAKVGVGGAVEIYQMDKKTNQWKLVKKYAPKSANAVEEIKSRMKARDNILIDLKTLAYAQDTLNRMIIQGSGIDEGLIMDFEE